MCNGGYVLCLHHSPKFVNLGSKARYFSFLIDGANIGNHIHFVISTLAGHKYINFNEQSKWIIIYYTELHS